MKLKLYLIPTASRAPAPVLVCKYGSLSYLRDIINYLIGLDIARFVFYKMGKVVSE